MSNYVKVTATSFSTKSPCELSAHVIGKMQCICLS